MFTGRSRRARKVRDGNYFVITISFIILSFLLNLDLDQISKKAAEIYQKATGDPLSFTIPVPRQNPGFFSRFRTDREHLRDGGKAKITIAKTASFCKNSVV